MTSQNALLERNLTAILWGKILNSCLFLQPVVMLFYMFKGLTAAEFFQAQIVMSFAIIMFDIPCSYLSDRWNRKFVYILGSVGFVAANSFLFFVDSFATACVVFFLSGFSYCMIRGPLGAFLYDTLLALGREEEHTKIFGRLAAISRFVMGSVAIVAGFLYSWNEYAPLVLQITAQVLIIVVALFMVEPPRSHVKGSGVQFKVLCHAILMVFKHEDLKYVAFAGALLCAVSSKAYFVIQPVMSDMNVSLDVFGFISFGTVALIGAVSALTAFTIAFCSYHCGKVIDILGMKKLMFISVIFSMSGYALCALFDGYFSALFALFMVFVAFGFSQVMTQTMVNERVASEIRATVLSVVSVFVSITFAIVTFVFSMVLEKFGMVHALYTTCSFIAVVGYFSWRRIQFMKEHKLITVLAK